MLSDEGVKHCCKSAERVLIGAFTTRNTVPFGLLFALCILLYKLPGGSLEKLLTLLIESAWFTLLGWGLLAVVLFGGWRLFLWRERLHDRELQQVIKVRDRLIEEQLKLKLDNPPLKLEGPK